MNQPECQTVDKNNGRIEPKVWVVARVAKVNANGGTITVSIMNDSTISGIDEMTESIIRQDGFMLRASLSS